MTPTPANLTPLATERIAVSQTEAARLIGVTDRTIRNWTKAGLLTGKRVRGVRLYPVEQLKQLVGAK